LPCIARRGKKDNNENEYRLPQQFSEKNVLQTTGVETAQE